MLPQRMGHLLSPTYSLADLGRLLGTGGVVTLLFLSSRNHLKTCKIRACISCSK